MPCKVLRDLPSTPFMSSSLFPAYSSPATLTSTYNILAEGTPLLIAPQLQVFASMPTFPGCFLWPLLKIITPIPGMPQPPSLLYFYIYHQPTIYFTQLGHFVSLPLEYRTEMLAFFTAASPACRIIHSTQQACNKIIYQTSNNCNVKIMMSYTQVKCIY